MLKITNLDDILRSKADQASHGNAHEEANAVTVTIVTLSDRGVVKSAEHSLWTSLGFPNLANIHFSDIVHPDDIDFTQAALAACKVRDGGIKIRNRFRRSDGKYVPIDWTCVACPHEKSIKCSASLLEGTSKRLANNDLLSAVSQALSTFISEPNRKAPFETILNHLLTMSSSEYGFIGEVHYKNGNTPFLRTHAITNIGWDDASRELYDKCSALEGLEFHNLDSLFGRVMTSEKPVVSNSPSSDPRRGGIPNGHPALNAFLGLPIYSGPIMVGMIGVANRPGGYDSDLISDLDILISTCSTLIMAVRAERARCAADSKLEQGKTMLRAIVETVQDGIFTTDAAGNILLANPGFRNIFGINTPDVEGLNILDFITSADGCRLDLSRLSPPTGNSIYSDGSLRGLNNHGGELPVELALCTTEVSEKTLIVGTVRDVTDVKKAEMNLINAKHLAEFASKAKSQFLANMSHEIRTPMNGVIGMTELVMETQLTPVQRGYMETLKESSEFLLHIINDILDFSKIEAGRVDFEMARYDLSKILNTLSREFHLRARDKGLELRFDYSSAPEIVVGDQKRLRQVLLNILDNAVKFTERGSIAVLVQTLSKSEGRATVYFEVSDTGIGIAKDSQVAIFEPFQQADSSVTRRFGGTGLGLSICQSLLSAMGGTLELRSELHIGTTFSFTLTFEVPEKAIAKGYPPSGGEHRTEEAALRDLKNGIDKPGQDTLRILLAEDNDINQKLMLHMLERHGHFVALAEDGEKAVHLAAEAHFDVILMDVHMPRLGGLDATKQIRAQESGRDRRSTIIALTADAMPEDRKICIEAGMDAYLSKPVRSAELLSILSGINSAS